MTYHLERTYTFRNHEKDAVNEVGSFEKERKFPEKLFEYASDDCSLITWNKVGTAVVVNPDRFEAEVMKKYPGFMQISTFLNLRRQFRWYGFNWESLENGDFEFSHPAFLRDRPDLVELVVTRRKQRRGVGFDCLRACRPGTKHSWRITRSHSSTSLHFPKSTPLMSQKQAKIRNKKPSCRSTGESPLPLPPLDLSLSNAKIGRETSKTSLKRPTGSCSPEAELGPIAVPTVPFNFLSLAQPKNLARVQPVMTAQPPSKPYVSSYANLFRPNSSLEMLPRDCQCAVTDFYQFSNHVPSQTKSQVQVSLDTVQFSALF